MYLPSIGRFIQTDPTGFDAGDMNLFRYCGDDPVDRSDPTGLVDTSASLWNHEAWMEGGSFLTAAQFDGVRQGAGVLSWSISNVGANNPPPEFKQQSSGTAFTPFDQRRYYRPKNLQRFDRAIAHVFGKLAMYVPAQTLENAPVVGRTLNKRQLYARGLVHGARPAASHEAAGLTSRGEHGYTIYIARDTGMDPNRVYTHELANKLSGELTGSMRSFGNQNDPHGDPDTGAAVERFMYHDP